MIDTFRALTSQVHWPAVSAVLTFLALINTARIADRASRQQREKDAVFLEGTADMIDAAVEPARCILDAYRDEQDLVRSAKTALFIEENSDILKESSSIDQRSFPSVTSLKAFLSAKINLKIIHSEVKKISEFKESSQWTERHVEFFLSKIGKVEAAVKQLSRESRKANRRPFKKLTFPNHTDSGRYVVDKQE